MPTEEEIKEIMKDLGDEYEIKRKKPRDPNKKLYGMMVLLGALTLINTIGLLYIIRLLRG